MEDWDDANVTDKMQDCSISNDTSEPVGWVFAGRGRGFRPASNGTGGFRTDNDNGGFKGRRFDGDDNGGGGFRGRRNDGDDNGGSGFRGRRNDGDDNGGSGFRGRRNDGDENGGSGFRGRRNDGDDNGGSGFRGRRNDGDENGGSGFRGRRNDGDDNGGSGFRGRRNDGDENGGSGFRGRRNDGDENGGSGFRGRRNDGEENGGGGFRGRRSDGEENGGGGFRGRRNDGDEPRLDENGEVKKPPVTYVPPEPTEDENEIYGSGISSGINFDKYDAIPVEVTGNKPVPAIASFAESNLRPFLLEIVARCGYSKPTPIQKYAIPSIMAGRDIMACAQTGSGKTAAFLLPIIHDLLANQEPAITTGECAEPKVVIIAPTRELSIQINEEARKFTRGSHLKTCLAYGGISVGHQIRQILNGTHILVATVGRMIDFMNRGKISFAGVKFVVLDEADRMLEMGFKTEIDKMMSHATMVPKSQRRTLMFSATFPTEIQKLAGQYLEDYLFITVGLIGGACADIEQRFVEVTRTTKRNTLIQLLNEIGSNRTVVFVETKKQADVVSVVLSESGIPATSIHGDREQRQREEAIADFKSGRMHVLVATAVASRGLDIKGIAHVINYDMPKEIDEYVHRIGRTGRVGNKGVATSFYDPTHNSDVVPALVNMLNKMGHPIPDIFSDSEAGGDFQADNFGGQDFRDHSAASAGAETEEW